MGYRKHFYVGYNKVDPMERYLTPLDLTDDNLIRTAQRYPFDLISIEHLTFYDNVRYHGGGMEIYIREWEGTGYKTRYSFPMKVFQTADLIRYTDRRTGQVKILKDRYGDFEDHG